MKQRKSIMDTERFNVLVANRPMVYRGLKFIPVGCLNKVSSFLVFHSNEDGTAEGLRIELKDVEDTYRGKVYNLEIANRFRMKDRVSDIISNLIILSDPAMRKEYLYPCEKLDHEFSGEAAVNAVLNNLYDLKGCEYYNSKDLDTDFEIEGEYYDEHNKEEIIEGGLFDMVLCILEEMYESIGKISKCIDFKLFYIPTPNPLTGDYWAIVSKTASHQSCLSIIPSYYARTLTEGG